MATFGIDLRMLTVITAVVIAAVITLGPPIHTKGRMRKAFTKAVVLAIAAAATAPHHHGATGSWEAFWITRAVAADQSEIENAPDRLKAELRDRSPTHIPWEFAGPPDHKRTHSVAECINKEMHKPDPNPPPWWPRNIGIAEQPYAELIKKCSEQENSAVR